MKTYMFQVWELLGKAILFLGMLVLIFILILTYLRVSEQGEAKTDAVIYPAIIKHVDNAKTASLRARDRERFEFWESIRKQIEDRVMTEKERAK